MISVFYSPDYAAGAHAFDTTRKAAWVAESLATRPMPGIELREPHPLSARDLMAVHTAEYVDAVRTGEPRSLAESNGLAWDEAFYGMVRASNGGAVAAALEALRTGVSGSLSSGLHHAKRGRGAGFCTFNGLAVAARKAVDAGARGVLVLDLDAHCGGGTAELLSPDERFAQVDIAVDAFDFYEPAGRFTLDTILDAAEYLPTLQRRLAAVDSEAFDLVLYNAGMDPYERCLTGGRAGISRPVLEEREETVFEWCRKQALPVAFVLAGGYVSPGFDRDDLVDLHRLTLAAAARFAA